jgi:hypothetical protein
VCVNAHMRTAIVQNAQTQGSGFDLFRLSKSKQAVDLCPNTLRAYFKQGLPCYRRGKVVFISRAELAEFITKN